MSNVIWEAYIPLKKMKRDTNAWVMQEIQDEIAQNAAWWVREYNKLKARCFPPKPFDPAEHEGHSIIELSRFTSPIPEYICTECREERDW